MTVSDRRRKTARYYMIFLVAVFALLIFPVYGVANRVFPLVFGLPFGLFWVVLVEVLAFLALCGFYIYEHGGDDAA